MAAAKAIAWQTLRDARTRTITFALLFLWGAAAQGLAGGRFPRRQSRMESR